MMYKLTKLSRINTVLVLQTIKKDHCQFKIIITLYALLSSALTSLAMYTLIPISADLKLSGALA